MTYTQSAPGCIVRNVECALGFVAGWCVAAISIDHLASSATHSNSGVKLLSAVMGGLMGMFLREISATLEKCGVRASVVSGSFAVLSSVIVGIAYGDYVANGFVSAMFALAIAAFVLIIFDLITQGDESAAIPLLAAVIDEAIKTLIKGLAGTLIGICGGLVRVHLNVFALTTESQERTFAIGIIAAGVITYPLVLVTIRGRQVVRGLRMTIPLLDGALFAFFVAPYLVTPTQPFGIEGGPVMITNCWWVLTGAIMGLFVGLVVGGLQSLLLLVVANPLTRFGLNVLVDGVERLRALVRDPPAGAAVGRQAISAVVSHHPEPHRSEPIRRRVSLGVLLVSSLCGFLFFGMTALCHRVAGAKHAGPSDIPVLAPACPPDCKGARLPALRLSNVRLAHADLRSSDLAMATLIDADLRGTRLHDANLEGANLRNARLYQADFTRANLRVAILTFADLRGACFRDANLERAQLQSADLSGANLEGAKLRGVVYDDATMWPGGFDAVRAGAVKDGSW